VKAINYIERCNLYEKFDLLNKIDFNFLLYKLSIISTTMSASNNNTASMSLKTPQSNNNNTKSLEVSSQYIYNNTTTMQFTQSQTNPLEYCIGNDTYVVFETQPKFKIVTRNPAKDNYEIMLKELMNGKQKVLKKYVKLYTSDPKPMEKLPFYKQFRLDWITEEKANNGEDWTPSSHDERYFASKVITQINNEVVKKEELCDMGSYQFSVNLTQRVVKKKDPITQEKIGIIKNDWYYELSIKKTMDLAMTLEQNSVDISGLDDCGFVFVKDIWNKMLDMQCRLMPNEYVAGGGFKWNNKKNALGNTHNSPYGSYNADNRISYIEVLYARGGKSKSGKPMPNRIYRKNSNEMVDNPYSWKGQVENLRDCAEMNNIKRYSKMNKTQLVKALMNM